jgi:hypothetical protein
MTAIEVAVGVGSEVEARSGVVGVRCFGTGPD